MTVYACKYAPVEILYGFDEEPVLCNANAESFDEADKIIHRDLCAYSRALIEHRLKKPEEALVLTNCCDSLRRACDALKEQGQTVFLLDLPHKDTSCARRLYRQELLRFIEEFSAFSGRTFDCARFREACGKLPAGAGSPCVALLGARVGDALKARIEALSPFPVVNQTCTGSRRIGPAPRTDDPGELMDWYARELLSQPPCMRMTDIASRRELLCSPEIRGIIYNTVSFCDYYAFEYAKLRTDSSVPVLKIETDYTGQADAQLINRLDAFFENLHAPAKKPCPKPVEGRDGGRRYFAGIDSGSATTKAVILDSNRSLISFAVVPTGVSVPESAKKAYDIALKKAGLSVSQVSRTVSTGYGRTAVGFGSRDVTEITCHAKGAYFIDSGIRTVIDIGGQDSKVIRLNADGTVRDFVMNDKCAAGTGRFLEMMAQSLCITLDEMSLYGLEWDEEIAISSMCSVFAQSEVVSLIAAGKRLPDIVHGLNASVASKVVALGGRAGMEPGYMMTGGVAKNKGVVQALEAKLCCRIRLPGEPEICGALGAALTALEDAGISIP